MTTIEILGAGLICLYLILALCLLIQTIGDMAERRKEKKKKDK